VNWPAFFKAWGEQTEQLRQVRGELQSTNKRLADMERKLAEARSLQDQVRGAYKAAVGIGALIGALVTIAARVAGLL
jgi:hypothetical protein